MDRLDYLFTVRITFYKYRFSNVSSSSDAE